MMFQATNEGFGCSPRAQPDSGCLSALVTGVAIGGSVYWPYLPVSKTL